MLQNVLKCYRDATGFALCKFLFRYQPFPGPEMETYPFLVRSVLKSNTQSKCDCALYWSTDLTRDGYVSIQLLPFTPGPPTNAEFGKKRPILPSALPMLLNFYHLKMCYTRLSLSSRTEKKKGKYMLRQSIKRAKDIGCTAVDASPQERGFGRLWHRSESDCPRNHWPATHFEQK